MASAATEESSTTGDPNRSIWSRFGPGLIVTAAFIGPGTVTTASRAGAEQGLGLLWVIALAVAVAVIMQYLAAYVGIVTGSGLGEYLRRSTGSPGVFWLIYAMVVSAIGIGNAAYQSGNLTGAALGLVGLAGGSLATWITVIALISGALICLGSYRNLQLLLVCLVALLSVAFLITAIYRTPNLRSLSGGFAAGLDGANLTLAIGLLGTTIVPYNLFLHASHAAENWAGQPKPRALREAWWDTCLAISLGGLVTAAIVATASATFFDNEEQFESIASIAEQLRPVLGVASTALFSLGIFAAGITSSITAPLATAYAVAGISGWSPQQSPWPFRGIALAVILIGACWAILSEGAPEQVILFAQVANGLLLPLMAGVLLYAAFRLKENQLSSGWLASALVAVIIVACLALWKLGRLLT